MRLILRSRLRQRIQRWKIRNAATGRKFPPVPSLHHEASHRGRLYSGCISELYDLQKLYEIQKSIEDNPLFDSKKAQKKLRAYVEHNPSTIQIKAEIMLDHFIQNVSMQKTKRQSQGHDHHAEY